MNKKTILFYNSMFDESINLPKDIPSNVVFTFDKKHLYTAHAVIFHLPNLDLIPHLYKPKKQLWVAWCMESDVNYPFLKRRAYMDRFDIKMTYRLDSDIPTTYLYSRYQEILRRPSSLKSKSINAFISSNFNKSGRLQYLEELMKYLKIDSYGRIFNNCKLQKDDKSHKKKEKLISNYKFTIAFENSITKDYVTEKFFQPLAYGSIPIYLGAPNVENFAPGSNCFINVNDFNGPKDLAEYVTLLERDKDSYNSYFKWKQEPFDPVFNKLLKIESKHPLTRLSEKVLLY